MPDTDPLAAELAAIEYRQENGDLRDFVTHDSPRLLAAVKAALAKTDEWAPPRDPLEVLSETAERSSYLFAAKYARRDCAAELRDLISAALLGDEV